MSYLNSEHSVVKPLRYYEGLIIVHPDVNEAEQKALFKRNAEVIAKYKGRVNHLDTWGKRRLANPIKKMKMGTYFHTTFEADPACVAEIERLLGIDDRVLRFLHTRLDERKNINSYVEAFKKALAETHRREQEKDAKRAERRVTFAGGGGGIGPSDRRGPRRERDDEEVIGGASIDGDEA